MIFFFFFALRCDNISISPSSFLPILVFLRTLSRFQVPWCNEVFAASCLVEFWKSSHSIKGCTWRACKFYSFKHFIGFRHMEMYSYLTETLLLNQHTSRCQSLLDSPLIFFLTLLIWCHALVFLLLLFMLMEAFLNNHLLNLKTMYGGR